MSRVLGVIPARMGSSRFPGKPLAPIHGRPMIEHVFRGTSGCRLLDEVVIATCDAEIARAAEAFGARAVMTSDRHQRATDRVAEVSAGDPAELVVMVQGDEPMITAAMVESAIAPFANEPELACVNLAAPINSDAELLDPNTIKLVTSRRGNALYFSRQPIPHRAGPSAPPGRHFKQVCVIAFRRSSLSLFATLPQGLLEMQESVDMLRFVENDIPIRVAITDVVTHAVDTETDLALVAAMMRGAIP